MKQQSSTAARVQRTKLATPPGIKAGLVPRPRLVRALGDASEVRLLLVDAPVGYGKSTVLAQWAAEEARRRPFAWLSLDAGDSDPVRLLTHLVESIRLHLPTFGVTVEPALEAPGSSLVEGVVPRLLDELAAVPERLVVVLDDYHSLRGRKVHDLMGHIVAGLPPTTQIALATRSDPPLPLGRLRATGAMFELRASDLRFDEEEAGALLASSGITLEPGDLSKLFEASEGWPAGIYLAALSLKTEPDRPGFVRAFAGTHRHVADYLSEEVLRRQPRARLTFLLQTSILARMCGPLCDAVMEAEGSQKLLDDLERSNLFVVALDDEREWYRYHHLFGQMLQAELTRTEPTRVAVLHRRASEWFDSKGWPEEALSHALAARDFARSGELIARHWLDLFNTGRLVTVRRWLYELGDAAVATNPAVALTAGWVSALAGEPEAMERWLGIAGLGSDAGPVPDGTASFASGVSIVRGLFGYEGLEARRAHLAQALELEPADSEWRSFVLWGLGHVALLSGDAAAAKGLLDEVLGSAPPHQAILTMIALSELALAEVELGHAEEGMTLVRRAEAIAEERGVTSDARSSSVSLALGAVLVAKGDLSAGHDAMERALELRRSSGRLAPWATLEVLIALAPVRFTLGDVPGAKELLDEARTILAGLEDAGDLPRRVDECERLLRRADRQVEFGETLTDREMAIIRLMPTHLSLREIGAELFLSINTVKTHSRTIYRKLGVSSRRQAVERARDLELL